MREEEIMCEDGYYRKVTISNWEDQCYEWLCKYYEPYEIQRQVDFTLSNGEHYIADFVITENNGARTIIDPKAKVSLNAKENCQNQTLKKLFDLRCDIEYCKERKIVAVMIMTQCDKRIWSVNPMFRGQVSHGGFICGETKSGKRVRGFCYEPFDKTKPNGFYENAKKDNAVVVEYGEQFLIEDLEEPIDLEDESLTITKAQFESLWETLKGEM